MLIDRTHFITKGIELLPSTEVLVDPSTKVVLIMWGVNGVACKMFVAEGAIELKVLSASSELRKKRLDDTNNKKGGGLK